MKRRRHVSEYTLLTSALRKSFLAERLSPAEKRAIRRRGLPNGSILMPRPADAAPMGMRLLDPRLL